MKVVTQRVNYAKLSSGDFYSEIGFGLLLYVGVSKNDTDKDLDYLARKVVTLRQFRDDNGKSVNSLIDVSGECMCVSNFTLQSRIESGTRADYSHAAGNEFALEMYEKFMDKLRTYGVKVEKGNFGAHMHIDCSIDGPFTIILESEGRTK